MTVYFFDRVGKGRSEYDYRGCALQTPDSARQMAELIAIDLSIDADGSWMGWTVDVLDARGKKFFSVPVAPDLAAA
jgi:hypothetical protein